jgi:cytochrome P450
MDTTDAALGSASDETARLARFLAQGTQLITGYDEVIEVMRHTQMRTETLDETRRPFLADILHDLHGPDHIFRRRVMNRLVRPDALERYRDEITLRTLMQRLRRLEASPDPDGCHRVDLLQFSRVVFTQFAAAILGVDAASDEAADDLGRILEAIDHGMHAKFMTEEPESAVAEGIRARDHFRARYVDPAIAKCPVAHDRSVTRSTPSLTALLAEVADPAWTDEGLRVRESIALVIAAVGTSSALITSAVDELNRWFSKRPEDRALSGDLSFLALALQETLRLRTPGVDPYFERQAMEDIVLTSTGRTVKQGQFVAAVMRVANHDRAVFGADADEFNPRRELPPSVPRYGISFGAGQHQCLGLRVVLGNDGVGSAAYVLKTFLAAGIEPDPEQEPELEPGDRYRFRRYPVVFNDLQAVTR